MYSELVGFALPVPDGDGGLLFSSASESIHGTANLLMSFAKNLVARVFLCMTLLSDPLLIIR